MQNESKVENLPQPVLTPGQTAPHFEVESTQGIIRLNDYKDKWVILLSQPTDFCPIWANEIQKFAYHFCKLRDLNCELIGIGGSNVHSPLMWSKAVQDEFGVKIWFPVVLDPFHYLASTYGMIDPEDESGEVNCSICIIDDKQVLRAIVYYDPTVPDTMIEIVKLIRLLQNSDACGIVTPESWRPGDEWILRQVEIESSTNNEEQEMWYF